MTKHNLLVVVDMQNDFITGCLGSRPAEEIVPQVSNFIRRWKDKIIVTRDNHLNNAEGYIEKNYFPTHCVRGEKGAELHDLVRKPLNAKPLNDVEVVCKDTFAFNPEYIYWGDICGDSFAELDTAADYIDTIYICGLVTDICVISNALMLRSTFPKNRIVVLEDLCAGTSYEAHDNALQIMEHCCIEVHKSTNSEIKALLKGVELDENLGR